MHRLGWIGVGLDGTLAHYDERANIASIGEPIPAMVQRVQHWLAEGITVKIFTARVGFLSDSEFVTTQTRAIQDWCEKYIGKRLEVTCIKDFAMLELWDDHCIRVVSNMGQPVAIGSTG